MTIRNMMITAACGFALTASSFAQTTRPAEETASSSLFVTTPPTPPTPLPSAPPAPPSALRAASLFAVLPPQPRTFKQHDLVQIIVRETSQAKSSQDLTAKKDSSLSAKVPQWPNLNLHDLLNFQIKAGDNSDNPSAEVDLAKDFKGEGDYERKDDLTARLSAEVVEVLPNGNLILEARTSIKTDEEVQAMKATGICRQEDITAANTVLSNQIHDLVIEKMHTGELRKAGEKGVIAKILDIIFAF